MDAGSRYSSSETGFSSRRRTSASTLAVKPAGAPAGIPARSFADFETAVRIKLIREIAVAKAAIEAAR